MSFETVFERWLQKQGGTEEGSSSSSKRKKSTKVEAGHHHGGGDTAGRHDGGGGDTEDEEEMPVIQREAWREEEMEGMPVLQKMVDLPEERKMGSPPPPPLQITLSLSDGVNRQWWSKGPFKPKPLDKTKGNDKPSAAAAVEKEKNQHQSCVLKHQRDDISALTEKKVMSRVLSAEGERAINNMNVRSACSKQELQHRNVVKDGTTANHQCQVKSALSELTQLNHLISPITARSLGVDMVHSPECDLPMEPDSTSEFVLGAGRFLHVRKEAEQASIRGVDGSPWGEVSPHSATSVGVVRTPPTTVCSNREVARVVRSEQSPAECDSTSMFMNSPNAISPASQGEIEERVCPVLADHEEGASPSHFVCRCRSLPPPSDLIRRARVPVTAVSAAMTSQQQVNAKATTISSQAKAAKSWTQQDTRTCTPPEDDPAPDLEKVAPSLDLMATPEEGLQSDHESPPVLSLPEQESRVKQFNVGHSHTTKDTPKTIHQQEAPPLIRYGPEPPQVSNRDSPPVLISNDFHSQEKSTDSPPVLSLHGQEVTSKPSKSSKRRVDVCDFTSGIDWKSAVVETVENPPSLTKYDSEGKPGIILKIRTKCATPSVQFISKPECSPKPLTLKRKIRTVDNAEILSRLRKRHKTEEADKATMTEDEGSQPHAPAAARNAPDVQHKQAAENFHVPLGHTRPKVKRLHHSSTMQQPEGLKIATQDFTQRDSAFALYSVELFRLQTLAHDVVCVLFPHLQPHLVNIAPDSQAFLAIVDDIILSLEHTTSEEVSQECEDVTDRLMNLSLKRSESVPVFSPQVVLCGAPGHMVEDFREKLCRLFQLLLPDLTVSLTQNLANSSEQLEMFLRKVILVNKAKPPRMMALPCP